MSSVKNFFSLLLGFILLALVAWFAYLILQTAWDGFRSYSEQTQANIGIGMFALLGTVFSVSYTKYRERKLQLEALQASKKQKIYGDFLKGLFVLINEQVTEDFSHKFRVKFMSNALLWSSSGVLEKYHKVRRNSQYNDDDLQTMSDIASLILEFRKDLGLNNKKITEQAVLEIIYDQEQLDGFMESRIAKLLAKYDSESRKEHKDKKK